MPSAIPSENLLNLKLTDGWEVVDLLTKSPTGTGGFFSTGYTVKNGRQVGYLKALDFSTAFASADVPRKLQELTEAYNFERDLLYKCKGRRMDKVVYPIADGSVNVPGFPPGISTVYYIIFEMADGDIRKVLDTFKHLNLAFTFRSLHNTAVGMEQLHKSEIAHQDLKPSNVLVFSKESKVGDIGRASDKNRKYVYDGFQIPGDRNYAPLEQQYDFHFSNDFNEKYAADLFLFGSLFFFFFSGLTAAQAFRHKAKLLGIPLTSGFEHDLPFWERVLDEVLADLGVSVHATMPDKEADEVIVIARSLCCPDPRRRGHPRNVGTGVNQFSLERYISRLDILAKKAEFRLI